MADEASHSSTNSPPLTAATQIRVIPEIYDHYNDFGYKQSLKHLDAALEDRCLIVVIESKRLGTETYRWIKLAEFANRASLVCGVVSLTCAAFTRLSSNLGLAFWPSAIVSLPAFVYYRLCCLTDPCSAYRIQNDHAKLEQIRRDIHFQQNGADFYVVYLEQEPKCQRLVTDFVSGAVALLVTCKLFVTGCHLVGFL